MKIFFSSWQGLTLVTGAVVIVVLALALIVIPAPERQVMAPIVEHESSHDVIDDALVTEGAMSVVAGPVYGTLDEEGTLYGVLLMASGSHDDSRYYLTLAPSEGGETVSLALDTMQIPQNLLIDSAGVIRIEFQGVDEDDVVKVRSYRYRAGELIDKTHE